MIDVIKSSSIVHLPCTCTSVIVRRLSLGRSLPVSPRKGRGFSLDYSVSSVWILVEPSKIAQYLANSPRLNRKFKQCISGHEWRNLCFPKLDTLRSSLQAWLPRCQLRAGCFVKMLMCSYENAGWRFCRPDLAKRC